jgi:RNA polymerase sigma-70 factor (ECF subfamily)
VSLAEAELLRKVQQKDEDAFAELVEIYQTPVYNLCYRMLGSAEEAEDAAQESFWRAYQAIHRYDPTRSFITWLLSIAAHYCIDLQRKRKLPVLEIDGEEEFEIPDRAMEPEKMLSNKQEKEMITGMLKKISETDRAVIILRYWQEMPEEEIAKSLSLTISAVKSRLHRARLQLAKLMLEPKPTIAIERNHHESPAF